MKKLLGLLAAAPMSLTACAHVEENKPVIDHDTVIEVHEDKADLIDVYKVQDYEAWGTELTGTIQYYIEAKSGADLTGWSFHVELEFTDDADASLQETPGLIEDTSKSTAPTHYYDIGHNLKTDRQVQFALDLDLTTQAPVTVSDVSDYYNDDLRTSERAEAYRNMSPTAPYSEVAAVRNYFSYFNQDKPIQKVTSYYQKIDLIGIKGTEESRTPLIKTTA